MLQSAEGKPLLHLVDVIEVKLVQEVKISISHSQKDVVAVAYWYQAKTGVNSGI